jgi:hypothetical protein
MWGAAIVNAWLPLSFQLARFIAAAIIIMITTFSFFNGGGCCWCCSLSCLSENSDLRVLKHISTEDFISSLGELGVGRDSLSKFLLDGVLVSSESESGETDEGDDLEDLSHFSVLLDCCLLVVFNLTYLSHFEQHIYPSHSF